jgi:hypothetical protein
MTAQRLLLLLGLFCVVVVHAETHVESATRPSLLENVMKSVVTVFTNPMSLFVSLSLPELLKRFESLYDSIMQTVESFTVFLGDFFRSKKQIATSTKTRFEKVDQYVRELVQLRKQMEKSCRSPKDEESRSLCISEGMGTTKKLQLAQKKRSQLRKKYETYEPYLES